MAERSLHALVRRGALLVTNGLASHRLRGVTALGRRARVWGEPFIENSGTIRIGDDFQFWSRPERSHLVAGHRATLTIGNRVTIGAGAAVAAEMRVEIGDDVKIGRLAMILDTDFHRASGTAKPERLPVVIERNVRLDSCVTVLKGARIGEGAWVGAGSVVSGIIAPGAFVCGVPARPARGESVGASDPHAALLRVKGVMAETFGLARMISVDDGPQTIPQWDSLGALRLLLALEEDFGVSLDEDTIGHASSVGALVDAVLGAAAQPAFRALSVTK